MTNKILISLISTILLVGCSANNSKSSSKNAFGADEVVLPDVFKNTNYCNIAVEYYSGGLALILDENNNPNIQNVSFEEDFYSIEFERLPMTKKNDTYFLPFKVTNQIIDDGYLKNNTEYKFWLSYVDSTYNCGISLNDDTITEPTATLVEGLM